MRGGEAIRGQVYRRAALGWQISEGKLQWKLTLYATLTIFFPFVQYMGKSKFNPIFEFDYHVNGEDCRLRVTSVLGHVMGLKYPDHCKNW